MDPLNEDSVYTVTKDINENFASLLKGPSFQPGQAREKWLRKRTSGEGEREGERGREGERERERGRERETYKHIHAQTNRPFDSAI